MSDEAHHAAVDNFVKLKLSYRFTAALVSKREDPTPRIRFLFSKPSDAKPEPEIVVWMDLEVLKHEGSMWTYALYFEGQKYRRVIVIDEKKPDPHAFNEQLIDKVFLQKAQVRKNTLWEP